MTDEEPQDGNQSEERKHRGHHVVEMATMRYDLLLNVDRALAWGDENHLEMLNATTCWVRVGNQNCTINLRTGKATPWERYS